MNSANNKRHHLKGAYFMLLFSMAFLINACGPSKKIGETKSQAYQFHTVIKGENLGKIANSYELTEEQIKILNPGIDFKKLRAGQEIKIPLRKAEIKKEKEEEKKEEADPKRYSTQHIALLLPLNSRQQVDLNQSDNEIRIEQSSIPWIQLFNGVQLALDSMALNGNNYTISVYDTWADSVKLAKIIRDSLFIKNDLVIGSGVGNFLSQLIAASSKEMKPLIIAQNNSAAFLQGHPQLYLTTPSVALQCQMMSEFIYKKAGKENIIILHQDNKKENDLAAIFATALEINNLKSDKGDSLKIKNTIYQPKLFDKTTTLLSKTKNNIIIIPSSDEAFVSPIISRLDSLKEYKFMICGLPTWENFESIDIVKLQKLQTHIFSSNYINYENQLVKNMRKQFIEKYKSDPGYYAFLGYSIVALALPALEKNGINGFHRELEKSTAGSLPVTFNFMANNENDGKENHYFHVLKFDDFKLILVK